jgi:hypothetical protein
VDYGTRSEDFDRGREDREGYTSRTPAGQSWGSQGYGQGYGSSYMGQGSHATGHYGQQGQGQFAGRGPRGYRRSDDRILEDINERLTQHPGIDAEEIEVKVQNGEVTLTGTVSDRACKRMAEDLAENVSGVREVRNELRVNALNQQQSSRFDLPNSGMSSQGSNIFGSRSETASGQGNKK